jgi:hypothetical protein
VLNKFLVFIKLPLNPRSYAKNKMILLLGI